MVLVTGGNGFLGSWLICYLLRSGKQVRALCRASSSLDEFNDIYLLFFPTEAERKQYFDQLQWVHGDLSDTASLEDAMAGCEDVYHVAALVSFRQRDRALLEKTNVEGTANVVNVALASGIRKLGYVSSIAALGREKPGDLIDEKTKWTRSKYNSNYAQSKHRAEMEVWRGIEEGLQAVIVNPGVIAGPGDWSKGTCKIYKDIWKGLPVFTRGINGYVDVRDVCNLLIKLTESEISRERYVLVSDCVSFEDYFGMIAKDLGKKPPRWFANKLISELAWRCDGILSALTGKKPLVTREMALAAHNICYYSADKVKKQLHFEFIPLSQTVKFTCNYFLHKETRQ